MRPPERAGSQVEKQHNDAGCDPKGPVIGALRPTGADTPKRWRKDDYGQQEEDAGDLEPEDSADAAKGFKESAQATAEAARSLAGYLTSGAGCRLRGGLVGRGLGSGGYALASDSSGDAQADAESAADVLRFHSVYDGSSGACRAASPFVCRLASCRAAAMEVR